ncbi:hypothetical protein TSOC_001815 [Tetrabaena socialis]|uniref:Methyltransferase type 11 domain-containing protein n=1 Tax=Tetrabaena socialis TaxID=47790 RepID=A0A2J8AFY2_9CHLO|nr:hypothetical protein TSOC_001815 [Tetrabaena socialis]|eukprot:PNH11420.1 hypothetical protein TSOC_001815 [Tetrabaena socialis]
MDCSLRRLSTHVLSLAEASASESGLLQKDAKAPAAGGSLKFSTAHKAYLLCSHVSLVMAVVMVCFSLSQGPPSLRQAPLPQASSLVSFGGDGSVRVKAALSSAEVAVVQRTTIDLLKQLFKSNALPVGGRFQKKGALDRLSLEAFMDRISTSLPPVSRCLEWGPYQRYYMSKMPYADRFKCEERWTFDFSADKPRVRKAPLAIMPLLGRDMVYGDLNRPWAEQFAQEELPTFDLVIIPQVFQYVAEPLKAAAVLFEMVNPGGYVAFSVPFLQTIYADGVDYYRYTIEAASMVFKSAGFEVQEQYIGGSPFYATCWLLSCGIDQLTEEDYGDSFLPYTGAYKHKAYMLSMLLLKKPLNGTAMR